MKQTQEQLDFSETVKASLAGFWSLTEVQAYAEGDKKGLEGQVWTFLLERGLADLTVAEDLGGSGASLMDTLPVLLQGGARLLPSSWVYRGLLPSLVMTGDSPAERELVSTILGGGRGWVFVDAGGGGTAGTQSRRGLSRAQILPVSKNLDVGVLGDAQLRVYEERQLAPFVTRHRTPDWTRSFSGLAMISDDLEPARVVDIDADTMHDYRLRWRALQLLTVAADSVGGAQRCLDISVEHAKARHQFGVAIGTFQAVKHRLVDVHAAVRLAESALFHAAWLFDSEGASSRSLFTARIAKLLSSRAYFQASETSIQVFGGMGFTWEVQCHWHVKRAMMNSILALEDARAEEEIFESLMETSVPMLLGDVLT